MASIQSTSAAAGSSAIPSQPIARLPTSRHVVPTFAVHAGHENFASSFKAQKQDENPRCWMDIVHGGEKRKLARHEGKTFHAHPPVFTRIVASVQLVGWWSSCTTRPLQKRATTSGFCARAKERGRTARVPRVRLGLLLSVYVHERWRVCTGPGDGIG